MVESVMIRKKVALTLLALQILLLSLNLVGPIPAQAQTVRLNSGWSFTRLWERTDYPVAMNLAQRSWYWGPAPFAVLREKYAQTPGEAGRTVYYWDKSRMEITNPASDPQSKWHVSNGLLVREMVTGRVQIGDSQFEDRQRADVPVSGDGPATNALSPTYSSFRNLLTPALRQDAPVTATLDRAGSVGNDAALANRYPETAASFYEPGSGHNVPGVFWQFLNLSGPITVDQRLVNDRLEDWLFSFGLPLTEAYWTRSIIGGQEKRVLVQLFERRVLTYTPDNPPGYRVEMGNVGRHYYAWRYGKANLLPAPAAAFTQPALYLSIPTIGLNAGIEYVAKTADGAMATPLNPLSVGWYRLGAHVGEKGNAVLAGHLDWRSIGPAVFYNLDKLKPGDMVYVTTTLGYRHAFRVTEIVSYPLNDYPAQRIFGESDQSNLNLITCNGSFNPASASYNRRLIVYTRLVE